MNSLPSKTGLFSQSSLVRDVALIIEIVDTVKELASLTVLAVTLFVVLSAELGLVVGWEVLLWYKFIHVVSI